ncbi:MAG TPA: Ig-like domain-containing protein, partial [Chitinophaga sp.]|nr:Ig-like domain-containing protein [Chitinophaga sp.]
TTSSDYSTVSFTPEGTTVADFKSDIATLQAAGRKVLLSLGGETGTLMLNTEANKQAFISSMKGILDSYNFDGFDIDIEGGTSLQLNNGDNNFTAPTTPKVVNLIAAVKEIVAYRKAQGKNCLLTMAPETYYVQTAYGATYSPLVGAYLPIIYGLRNELSWIQPQLYNTGSVMGLDNKVYSSATADFIVSMTEMLLQGFSVSGTGMTFPALREDQVAFGLPAAPGAAGSGYTAPAEVKKALNYLLKGQSYGGSYTLRKAAGYPNMRGIMTWSVNWDKVNNGEFATNYYPFFGGTVTPGNQAPVVSLTSPAANASFTAPATVNITASASDADGTISKVEFYRGTTKLGEATSSPYTYTWSNVAAGSYSLTAVATDNGGAVTTSAAVSITVNGTGGGTCNGIAAWVAANVYTQGMQVVYNNRIYKAKWWTQNEQPDTHSGADQVWAYVSDCDGGGTDPEDPEEPENPGTGNCAGVPTYEPYPKIYNIGDKVVYNGNLYESLANSLYNVTPGTADWWWKPLGACTASAARTTAAVVDLPVGTEKLVVFPNPLTGSVLNINLNAAAGEKVAVELWSADGSTLLLRREYTAGYKGSQKITLDASRVPAGTWILKTVNIKNGRKGSAKVIRL